MRSYFAFLHGFALAYALISLARVSAMYNYDHQREILPEMGVGVSLVCGVLLMPGVKIVRVIRLNRV